MTRPPNGPKKGRCQQCLKNNVLIDPEYELCIDCHINKVRLEIQQLVKEEGLKSAQILWETLKSQLKNWLEEIKQSSDYHELVSEEEKKQIEKNYDNFLQTIEDDLYPERKKARQSKRNWIIAGIVILVIIVLGGIAYWWYKKDKEKQ